MNYKIPFSINEPEKLFQYKNYLFDEYNYYCEEREKIKKEIIFSLNDKVAPYPVNNWFRLINTKYLHHPLNCKGSMENSTGGRFNIGKIKEGRFPTFPALYIGNEKETCIKEIYEGMTHFFNTKRGDSFFRVSGYIHSLLDITAKNSLNEFVKVIKQITLSKKLQRTAKQLNIQSMRVCNITQLKKRIYDKNWRIEPNICDIPAVPQIFGQLVKESGIEAILYKSTKKSRLGLCMAVFPENFKNSDSYIELEDCPDNITHKRMDLETFENFY